MPYRLEEDGMHAMTLLLPSLPVTDKSATDEQNQL